MKNIGMSAVALVAVCLSAGAAQATATDNAGTHTLSNPVKVRQLSTSDTTWSKLVLDGPFCGPSAMEFSISKSHPVHAQMYQTVLAAFMAEKPINIRWEVGVGGTQCWIKAVTLIKTP